jgi:hypothetical protein
MMVSVLEVLISLWRKLAAEYPQSYSYLAVLAMVHKAPQLVAIFGRKAHLLHSRSLSLYQCQSQAFLGVDVGSF